MAEYIEIIECRDCESKNCDGCNIFVLSQMLNDGKLDSLMDAHHSIIPAADVAPVVHGRWVEKFFTNDRQRVCSACHCTVRQPSYDRGETALFNYCPHCGAHMKEGE